MENSETGPTIFLKLAQREVQGYPGRWSNLEENSSTSFPVSIFQKWTVLSISGRLAQSGIVYQARRAAPRETRGREGIVFNLSVLENDATYDNCKNGDVLPDTSGAHRY